MSRLPRQFQAGFSYHITTRCNNREFRLTRLECRQVFLFAIEKALKKYQFKLYGLCIMSNHVHYLLEPREPEDMPKIMHFLNWYTAMCFNRMLNRTGHFWEKRYHSTGFENTDKKRALNTLRYIHANPKTARIQEGFFYDFSNYGVYDRLGNDGLTTWHPAFLELGHSLTECAEKYRQFCKRYKPKPKPERQNHWGTKVLAGLKAKGTSKKASPGQMSLPWDQWQASNPEIVAIAEKFIFANCYSQKIAGEILRRCSMQEAETRGDFWLGAVPGIGNPEPAWLREKEPFNNS